MVPTKVCLVPPVFWVPAWVFWVPTNLRSVRTVNQLKPWNKEQHGVSSLSSTLVRRCRYRYRCCCCGRRRRCCCCRCRRRCSLLLLLLVLVAVGGAGGGGGAGGAPPGQP